MKKIGSTGHGKSTRQQNVGQQLRGFFSLGLGYGVAGQQLPDHVVRHAKSAQQNLACGDIGFFAPLTNS